MVSYTQQELLSITDFTKSISKVLNSIKNNSIEKIGILRNNKLEGVFISSDEYERLKALDKFIEEQEDEELLKIVEERLKTPESEYISMEEMSKMHDIDLSSL